MVGGVRSAKAYLAHRLLGVRKLCATVLWYKYKHTKCPAVNKPTITHSALKPRWLMGRWQAHQVHTMMKSRK